MLQKHQKETKPVDHYPCTTCRALHAFLQRRTPSAVFEWRGKLHRSLRLWYQTMRKKDYRGFFTINPHQVKALSFFMADCLAEDGGLYRLLKRKDRGLSLFRKALALACPTLKLLRKGDSYELKGEGLSLSDAEYEIVNKLHLGKPIDPHSEDYPQQLKSVLSFLKSKGEVNGGSRKEATCG